MATPNLFLSQFIVFSPSSVRTDNSELSVLLPILLHRTQQMTTKIVKICRAKTNLLVHGSPWQIVRKSTRGKFSVGCFLEEVYTKKRIYSALSYLTPVEFEAN